jgi:sepiapterin reductase
MTEKQKSFILITGSSKGFGKAIATSLLKTNLFRANQVHLVITGRNATQLNQVKDVLHTSIQEDGLLRSHQHVITAVEADLTDPNSIHKLLPLTLIEKHAFNSAYLFNNAGSLGPLQRISTLCHSSGVAAASSTLRDYFELNLTNCFLLTSLFVQLFKHHVSELRIVNVSSLAALQPFDCWSLYCSAKAARDMFFRNLVIEYEEEQKESSDSKFASLSVLNYAPGPLDTDMQQQIRESMPQTGLRDVFVEMKRENKLLTAQESADKLVSLLETGSYENGAHVDFYDV